MIEVTSVCVCGSMGASFFMFLMFQRRVFFFKVQFFFDLVLLVFSLFLLAFSSFNEGCPEAQTDMLNATSCEAAVCFLVFPLRCVYAPLNPAFTVAEIEFEFQDLPCHTVVVMQGEDNSATLQVWGLRFAAPSSQQSKSRHEAFTFEIRRCIIVFKM